jgi:hypothetical protein
LKHEEKSMERRRRRGRYRGAVCRRELSLALDRPAFMRSAEVSEAAGLELSILANPNRVRYVGDSKVYRPALSGELVPLWPSS